MRGVYTKTTTFIASEQVYLTTNQMGAGEVVWAITNRMLRVVLKSATQLIGNVELWITPKQMLILTEESVRYPQSNIMIMMTKSILNKISLI